MCVIGITLSTTTSEDTTIVSSSGRYRRLGTSLWTNFVINLDNPQTPNIIEGGFYELEVNVTNSVGATSDWAQSTFQVNRDCGKSATIEEVGLGENTNCFSSKCIKVTPPDGESSTVVITKTGLGEWYGNSSCLDSTVVLSDTTEVISSPKTYSIGIDAA